MRATRCQGVVYDSDATAASTGVLQGRVAWPETSVHRFPAESP